MVRKEVWRGRTLLITLLTWAYDGAVSAWWRYRTGFLQKNLELWHFYFSFLQARANRPQTRRATTICAFDRLVVRLLCFRSPSPAEGVNPHLRFCAFTASHQPKARAPTCAFRAHHRLKARARSLNPTHAESPGGTATGAPTPGNPARALGILSPARQPGFAYAFAYNGRQMEGGAR